MEKLKKLNLSFSFFLIIALLICSVATVFSVKDIQRSTYLDRVKSLDFVMAEMGKHLNVTLESKWNMARFLSSRIERSGVTSIEGLIKELNDIYVETGADFRVVDDKGIAYYRDGKQEYWKDHRAVLPKEETLILSPLQFGLTNDNYMKYVVPLEEPLIIDDIRIMYTVRTESLSVLHKDFDTSNYGEGCLAYIIDNHGTFIYENGSKDPMADSYNFLAYVEKTVHFQYGDTFERFKEDIENGVNHTVLVEYNGKNYYLSHFNLAMENWVSIVLVPERNTQAEDSGFAKKLFGDIAIVFVTAFLLFITGFFICGRKPLLSRELRQMQSEDRMKQKPTFCLQ